jgi:hypothetical protein
VVKITTPIIMETRLKIKNGDCVNNTMPIELKTMPMSINTIIIVCWEDDKLSQLDADACVGCLF